VHDASLTSPSGRYIIVLMGLFSIYTGFMYNDIFSKSLHIWQSGWEWPTNSTGLVFAQETGSVYPFGLDSNWHGADNGLIFTNSYKMKMSIILGVIHVSCTSNARAEGQMSFAICLQVPNHFHFKKYLNIYAEFIPQILFIWSIFGYLLVCIIYKWSVDWSQSSTSPPGLLNMLIYMFLSPGTVDPQNQLYAGQGFIQVVLLLIALVCVPWMLCLKPYMLYREHHKIVAQGYHGLTGQENGGRMSTGDDLDDEEEGAGQPVAENMEEEHVSDLFALEKWPDES